MDGLLRCRFEPLVCGEIRGFTGSVGPGALEAVSPCVQGRRRRPDSAIVGYYISAYGVGRLRGCLRSLRRVKAEIRASCPR